MTRAYWDALADTYEQQIFSVLGHDQGGRLREQIGRWGGADRQAADLGCGPGQVTPLLAASFGHVHACDVSRRLLQRAQAACSQHDNVEYHRYDLASLHAPPFAPVDLVVCINVLLSPDLETRERLWQRVTSLVAAEGRLLLVVPSLESAFYTNARRLEWHRRAGVAPREAVAQSVGPAAAIAELDCGVRAIEGVPTKHYVREEIVAELASHSLVTEDVVQLNYDWTTEFADPPEWLAAPFPWNWLVVARRGAG